MAVIENFPVSIMPIKARMFIMNLISMMEIGKFSITPITAITEAIPKVHNGLNFHNRYWEIVDSPIV
jgi:hypothetical protein